MPPGKVGDRNAGVDPRFTTTFLTPDDEAFLSYHRQNPEVLDQLIVLAKKARDEMGQTKIGIRMLWEVLRWNTLNANVVLRLNDRWHSRYVRLICSTEPDLKPLFKTRSLKT